MTSFVESRVPMKLLRLALLAAVLGALSWSEPATAREPEASFYADIRAAFPKYDQTRSIRALAVCLDFHRSTRNRASFPSGYWYYKESGPVFTTTLVREALNDCVQEKRRQSLRDCDCVIVARNDRYRLEAAPQQLAKLNRAVQPPLSATERAQVYSGSFYFDDERVTGHLTMVPGEGGGTFSATLGNDFCRGVYNSRSESGLTWSADCERKGALEGRLDVEGRTVTGVGAGAKGEAVRFEMTRR